MPRSFVEFARSSSVCARDASLLTRQRSGDELDIAACVNAIVDRRIGETPDDRLYLDARPARRGLALALLVDVSGSTEAGVNDGLRIIDLEKIALLLAERGARRTRRSVRDLRVRGEERVEREGDDGERFFASAAATRCEAGSPG